MRSAVDAQTEARGYGTSSEYVRDLIRRDLNRQALHTLLDEGRKSAQDKPPLRRPSTPSGNALSG